MALDNSIYFASITELSTRLRAKEFSCVELTRAFSDRLEKFGPKYNALALSLRQDAVRAAKDVDDEIKRGRLRSVLQGIPFAVKDLLSYKGNPTTWGSPALAAQVFDYNAATVDLLLKAKAVLMGKLSMIELAGGGGYRTAAASHQGPCLNPWDITKWAGGSSSGSGAAVAAGLIPFALGSETSGSILTPSAFCGVTGLRPTYGLVSRQGAMALSWSLDKIGPMCRSAEDCGLVLQGIAGSDPRDPGSARKNFRYAPQFVRKFSDLSVGFHPADFSNPVFKTALDVFQAFGSKMVEVSLPEFPYGAVLSTILNGEASSAFDTFISSGKVGQMADQRQAAGLRATFDVTARDYLRAQRIRSLIKEEFRSVFDKVDVIIRPTRDGVASAVADSLEGTPSPATTTPAPSGLQAMIPASNLAGLPALAVPCGFLNGLPLSMSIVGKPFSENTLLAYGREYQARTEWHRRHPAVE
jgi:aspartyl-tRNA(Asn)/glutamyl-tRNA(Gln) amidotransferase subunit A